MSRDERDRWNRKWLEVRNVPAPARLLRSQQGLLSSGLALDVACGLGQNSIWLAQHNYAVLGVDLSDVALQRARASALDRGLTGRVIFAQLDLDKWIPAATSVDLICVFRFLDRKLIHRLKLALRPTGLLFFETRHQGALKTHPNANPDYLLDVDELFRWFRTWQTLCVEISEESAATVARKPRA